VKERQLYETVVPAPLNPQSYNEYSWVFNNPIRLIDPTGHFSEEEIMNYYGVETWDDVLAIFSEGGQLEGSGGWLRILRRAELGDVVTFNKFSDPYPIVLTLFSAQFVEIDGRLLLSQMDMLGTLVSGPMIDGVTGGVLGEHYELVLYGANRALV
jgi:hypothetical protein